MKLKELQREVDLWVRQCMGDAEADDKRQRAFRFFEEALELAQACGMTREEAGALADYTFSRPPAPGPADEVGGVLNTLSALCNAHGISMDGCAESEMAHVWRNLERIRAKHQSKIHPSGPLPGRAAA